MTRAEPNAQVANVGGFRVGLAVCSDANSKWLMQQYRAARIDALLYSVTSSVPAVSSGGATAPSPGGTTPGYLPRTASVSRVRNGTPGTVFVADPNGAMHALRKEGAGYVTAVIGRD